MMLFFTAHSQVKLFTDQDSVIGLDAGGQMGDDTPILALPARCFQIVGDKAGIDTAFSCSCNPGEIGHESQTIIECNR